MWNTISKIFTRKDSSTKSCEQSTKRKSIDDDRIMDRGERKIDMDDTFVTKQVKLFINFILKSVLYSLKHVSNVY